MNDFDKKDINLEFPHSNFEINWEQFARFLFEILEKIFDVLILLKKEGIITYISNKTADILAFNKSELIGKNLFDIVKNKGKILKIFNKKVLFQISNVELNIEKGDGGIGKFVVSVYEPSYTLENEKFNFVFIIGREIEKTEKNKDKKNEMDDFEFVDEKSKEKILQTAKISAMGILASSVAHEINTPLSGVLGYVELLINKIESKTMSVDEDYVLEKLKIIRECGNKCKTISEKFLEFSRKSTGNFRVIDINSIVEDAVSVTKSKVEYNAKIHKKFANGLLLVYGNANELQQVMVNLILNAGDAIEKNGNIWIWTKMDNKKNIKIHVKDDGIGMSDYILKNIFRPFFTTKPPGKGTGLGLSVCNGIIKKHKGRIDVISEEGKGTEFIITLPYYKKIMKLNTKEKNGEGNHRESKKV